MLLEVRVPGFHCGDEAGQDLDVGALVLLEQPGILESARKIVGDEAEKVALAAGELRALRGSAVEENPEDIVLPRRGSSRRSRGRRPPSPAA